MNITKRHQGHPGVMEYRAIQDRTDEEHANQTVPKLRMLADDEEKAEASAPDGNGIVSALGINFHGQEYMTVTYEPALPNE